MNSREALELISNRLLYESNLFKKDLEELERIRNNLEFLKNSPIKVFENYRARYKILGIDITDSPDEIEKNTKLIKDILERCL